MLHIFASIFIAIFPFLLLALLPPSFVYKTFLIASLRTSLRAGIPRVVLDLAHRTRMGNWISGLWALEIWTGWGRVGKGREG
jgi:hypothetical protein